MGLFLRLGAVFLFAALAACGSLPDASPFLQTTVELRSAIAAGGNAVDSELRASDELKSAADELSAAWKKRVSAADGMVAYAESLVAITNAGNTGGDAARAVADSVTGLAGAIGIALPPAAAVGVLTDTAVLIYQQIALVRGRRSLDEALSTAQPAIDSLAQLLMKDIDAMSDVLVSAILTARLGLANANRTETSFLSAITSEQARIYAAGTPDAVRVARLVELDRALAAMREWREPYEAKRKAIADRVTAGRQLLNATKQGVMDWAAAHRQLAKALQEGREINPAALAQTIVEIRGLIRRVREL